MIGLIEVKGTKNGIIHEEKHLKYLEMEVGGGLSGLKRSWRFQTAGTVENSLWRPGAVQDWLTATMSKKKISIKNKTIWMNDQCQKYALDWVSPSPPPFVICWHNCFSKKWWIKLISYQMSPEVFGSSQLGLIIPHYSGVTWNENPKSDEGKCGNSISEQETVGFLKMGQNVMMHTV